MRRFLKFCMTSIYKIKYINRCRISACSSIVLRGCRFEGKNSIGNGTYLSTTSLGYGSYTGKHCEFSGSKIGRFCSIGSNVRVVSANHPIDVNVATHPAFYSNKYYFSYVHQNEVIEHITTLNGYECELGNDVWIGDNVLIKGGVTIGNGAVIGMGSVVTHDVPPYTIVAGVPAKKIRKRFDDETITKLLAIQWWNKPLEWIEQHANEFQNPNEFVCRNMEESNIRQGV